jgi:hypothetical protein
MAGLITHSLLQPLCHIDNITYRGIGATETSAKITDDGLAALDANPNTQRRQVK